MISLDSISVYGNMSFMTEEWRVIQEFPSYEISNLGSVRRIVTARGGVVGHILSPGKSDTGHLFVVLRKDGKSYKQQVHRLVAIEFIGYAPFDNACVLHNDDIPDHNSHGNLRWGTKKENADDRKMNRGWHSVIGENNPAAILSEQNVNDIKKYIELGICGSCLAKIYGVNKETIYAINKGRTWKHLGDKK